MLNFASDYTEGCHPEILKALLRTNEEQTTGYGSDVFSLSAAEKIKKAIDKPGADIYFLTGGTQTNQTVIDSILKNYEGVIAPESGHIAVHEAGAIENVGHKVLTVPSHCGKLQADELDTYIKAFYSDSSYTHMVFPGMVYISHPTELGTLYTLAELKAISAVCREYEIPLFIDGARLGYGVMSFDTDVALTDIADIADVFYIGGTKVGALCGEAVVFPNGNSPKHFLTMVKQRGAMLAKGRLNGVQFDTLFTDGLYFTISRNAIERAEELKELLKELGYRFYIDSPTNQQFIIISDEKLCKLQKRIICSVWGKYDSKNTVIRLCTGWATTKEQISELKTIFESI